MTVILVLFSLGVYVSSKAGGCRCIIVTNNMQCLLSRISGPHNLVVTYQFGNLTFQLALSELLHTKEAEAHLRTMATENS